LSIKGIRGHEKTVEMLDRAIGSGRIPHSYLFTGISGIGKKLLAIKLAQSLQCGDAADKPCDLCNSCRKVTANNHPDVIVIEPDGTFIKIDQIRDLQKRLAYKPFEGAKTVCIIDGADKLNLAAANSLLKTVEEPPATTHLILIAENIRQVIPTIVSRCQRIKFHPLPSNVIEELLVKSKSIPPAEARSVARFAEGSIGKSLDFIESFPLNERVKLLTAFTGMKSVEEIFSSAEELTNKDNIEKLMKSLEILKFFLRDILLVKMGMPDHYIINIDYYEFISKKAQKETEEDLLRMIDSVAKTEKAIMMNANKKMAVINMLINITLKKETSWKKR